MVSSDVPGIVKAHNVASVVRASFCSKIAETMLQNILPINFLQHLAQIMDSWQPLQPPSSCLTEKLLRCILASVSSRCSQSLMGLGLHDIAPNVYY